jgi:hypothetical protein
MILSESWDRWRVDELFRLADAIAAAGLHTFTVRRTLQRLERGEITLSQACDLIDLTAHQDLRCVSRRFAIELWIANGRRAST